MKYIALGLLGAALSLAAGEIVTVGDCRVEYDILKRGKAKEIEFAEKPSACGRIWSGRMDDKNTFVLPLLPEVQKAALTGKKQTDLQIEPAYPADETAALTVYSTGKMMPHVQHFRNGQEDGVMIDLPDGRTAKVRFDRTGKKAPQVTYRLPAAVSTADRIAAMPFKPFEIKDLEKRPDFWRVRVDEIMAACAKVEEGRSEIIAYSPAGFPVYALFYGDCPRADRIANWSAASASGKIEHYTGKRDKQTFVWVSGTHGAETEGVAASMNLISLLETGKDLRGKKDPELVKLIKEYNFILIPCLNMDGRAICPDHLRGASYENFRIASQGQWKDGKLVGWLGSKQYFPLPIDNVTFPGGYPNSEGYNIMHDAAPGDPRTAEGQALQRLVGEYAADAFLMSHSCEYQAFFCTNEGFVYPRLEQRFWPVRDAANAALFKAGLQVKEHKPGHDSCYGLYFTSLIHLISGGMGLTLECSVTDKWTFDQMIDMNFVMLKAVLQEGLREPFTNRAQLKRGAK